VPTATETQRISRTVTPGRRPPVGASRAVVLDLVEGDTAIGCVFGREPRYVLTDGIASNFIAASTEGDGLPGQVALADLDQSVAAVDHGRAGHDPGAVSTSKQVRMEQTNDRTRHRRQRTIAHAGRLPNEVVDVYSDPILRISDSARALARIIRALSSGDLAAVRTRLATLTAPTLIV
jgi:hypothetical protein